MSVRSFNQAKQHVLSGIVQNKQQIENEALKAENQALRELVSEKDRTIKTATQGIESLSNSLGGNQQRTTNF